MPLTDFVQVNVTSAPAAPTQPGFGEPLILGAVKNATFLTDKIRHYTGLAGMVSDGFLTTDPEYLAAQAIFSQNPAPPSLAVGKRAAPPTQQFKITVLQGTIGKTYTVFINGVAKSFTAVDTVLANIATGLAAAIGTPTGFGAAAAVGAVITFTGSAAGNWCRVSVNAYNVDLDCWQSHADAGAQADLTAINLVDSTWYAVLSVFSGTLGSTNTSEVGQIAAWTEANGKVFLGDVQDSSILAAPTTDIASNLKTLSYTRTALIYHPDNGAFAAAAWAGSRLPMDPGSETWKFAQLTGVATVVLTATQQTNLESKNCNYYYSIGGAGSTAQGVTSLGGTTAAGYVDYVRGKDWLVSRIQSRIVVALTTPPTTVNPSTGGSTPISKVPFDDKGIAVIESELRAALQEGVARGFLASTPAPTVTVPAASAVTTPNKAARILTPVSFTAVTAGAIHKVIIAGVLQ